MGDSAIMNSVFSTAVEERRTTRPAAIAPATLDRWAAIARDRASYTAVPRQHEAA